MYHDLHGSPGLRTRFLTLLQMFAVAAVAVTIEGAFNGHHELFAISFAAVQAIISYLWWSTGYYDPVHKSLSKYYLACYLLSLGCFIASIFLPFQTAYILWGIGLTLNLTSSLIAGPSVVSGLKELNVE